MKLIDFYNLLLNEFGCQHWWPAETSFEVIVGAILTQNTNWQNVVKAITNLKQAGLLSIEGLATVRQDRIALLIKSSGYFNQKAERLQVMAKHLFEYYQGNLKKFFNRDIQTIRNELLEIKGIGPETADSILLYAGNKPVFVIDLYTKRIMERLGFYKGSLDYESLQDFFQCNLPENYKLFNEFHALLVEFAKRYCRKKPLCENCFMAKKCHYFNYD